jgi:hypothetical protein
MYPEPTATPRAVAFSLALPVTSWKTAMEELIPRPSRKRVRTVRPEPLGATRITSMFVGTSTLVRSLKTGEKPWEK